MATNPFPHQYVYGGMPLSADFLNGLMQRLDYIIKLSPEVSSESVDTAGTEQSKAGGGDDDRPGTQEVSGEPAPGGDGDV